MGAGAKQQQTRANAQAKQSDGYLHAAEAVILSAVADTAVADTAARPYVIYPSLFPANVPHMATE